MTDALSVHGPLAVLITSIAAWFLLVNVLTFAAFRLDKQRALAGEWRVPENTLLMLATLGGWPAAKIAQRAFRHKTRKQSFGIFLNLSILPMLALAGYGIAQEMDLSGLAAQAMASVAPASAADGATPDEAASAPKPTMHKMGQNAAPQGTSAAAKPDLPKRIGPVGKTSAWQSR